MSLSRRLQMLGLARGSGLADEIGLRGDRDLGASERRAARGEGAPRGMQRVARRESHGGQTPGIGRPRKRLRPPPPAGDAVVCIDDAGSASDPPSAHLRPRWLYKTHREERRTLLLLLLLIIIIIIKNTTTTTNNNDNHNTTDNHNNNADNW